MSPNCPLKFRSWPCRVTFLAQFLQYQNKMTIFVRDFFTMESRRKILSKLKSIGESILYYVLFGLWYIISCLPLWVLYTISTIFSFVLCYVMKYRKGIVHQNLKESYPDLSPQRLWFIERRFYMHFCDIVVESVKFFSMPKWELRRRMRFKGIELLEESASRGKSCGIFLGHYANWEWPSALPIYLTKGSLQSVQLYHPLENKVFNRLIAYTRQRFGGVNVPVDDSIRALIRLRSEGVPMVIGFVADQTPNWNNIYYWTSFLNHPETPVFTGAERLMRKFDMDVYYLDIECVRRGYYVGEFKRMTTTPKDLPPFALTEQYTRMMEDTINRAPSYWLWSHNRWKRTKQAWLEWTSGGRTIDVDK